MVKIKERTYNDENIHTVLQLINEREPVEINKIIFSLGPEIDSSIENAVKTLVNEDVIGSRDSFLKTHINFNPWDTIIYDAISNGYIGVNKNKMLYLKDKSRKEYNIQQKQIMSD